MVEEILQTERPSQAHRVVRPHAPFRKLLVERVLLGHHAVPERLKQFSNQPFARPARHNGQVCSQWNWQASQFLPTFAASRHSRPKSPSHSDTEKRREHIRPVVDVLIERATLMLSSLTTNQPYRIDIEQ